MKFHDVLLFLLFLLLLLFLFLLLLSDNRNDDANVCEQDGVDADKGYDNDWQWLIIIDYQEVKNGEGDGKETDNDGDDGHDDDGDDGADEKTNWQNCDVTCTPNTRLLFHELQHALTHVSLSAKTERWQTNACSLNQS